MRNHPKRGSSIKVEPIREMPSIQAIKRHLTDQPRNLCLFVLGINTAFRANELLPLRISDVANLREGDGLEIKQSKNQKYRRASLNGIACEALRQWLSVHPDPSPSAPLFLSQKGGAISVSYVCQLVKGWCAGAGLKGNYGSHILRKTWGYQQRIIHNAPTALLMRAFGHASEVQTLAYLCIQPEEIRNLYLEMEL
ncbi:MAG: tyrosine-type recombinase/integrase [Alphaproteobacteria bacterium]